MKKVWQILSQDKKSSALLEQRLAVSSLLSKLILNRGIFDPVEAEKFLFNSLYDLPDPYLLKNMDKAVKRIKRALQMREKIMVLSDYDVDGVTSLALLYQFFKMNNIAINWYLPHRIDEGYGISMVAVDAAIKEKTDLFISADCGITADQEIARLKSSGCDVIVIDHHRPKAGSLPLADAIIDPWQEDCLYPDKDLAAVGLVFKVLQAIMGIESRELLDFLDLVCLGTVADVASLRGENRTLVKYGLKALANTRRRGLIELCNVASLKLENITVRNIAFVLGPRLNAAGRIDSAEDAFSLLVTDDTVKAQNLALKL
ncbi:MAG: DHH family phosphoesterase, partial [Candidatus Omnitrophica bacterium]|nr:DHH family phosphoesterase [Candidatus Omnitrophota bacterium]